MTVNPLDYGGAVLSYNTVEYKCEVRISNTVDGNLAAVTAAQNYQ